MAPEESSVGKRIVEALKMQNGGEEVTEPVSSDSSDMLNDSFDDDFGSDTSFEDMSQNDEVMNRIICSTYSSSHQYI